MDLATEPGLTSALRARGYQVRGPAGVGAGGTAWAASDSDGRRVVVGVLDLDVTLAERRAAVDRLDRLREVEHPHLARLVDVVALDGHRTALVTEAVDGPTVGAVLSVRPAWTPGEVVTLVVPLAEALGALHAHGLVHGDVAPENVVLAPGGRPVLIDLAGIVLGGGGTRGFASPRGHGTPSGDVHALARLGLAALRGSGMPDGEAPGHREVRAVLESALLDRADPAALAAACFDAAVPEPVDLPDTAVLTRVALTRLTDARDVERTLPDPRAARWRRATALTAAAVCAVVLVAGGALVLPKRPGDPDVTVAATHLTERRAEVLTAGDPSRLVEVAVEGSPAFTADQALMASLESRGEDPHVQARVLEAQWLGRRDGRDLVAVTFAQRVGGTESEPRAVVLALVETPEGWRVMDVLGHVEVGDVSAPVGPLAG